MSKQEANAPHPRREPRLLGRCRWGGWRRYFLTAWTSPSGRFSSTGDSQRRATVCYIDGQARTERLNDYVLRPLAQDPMLASAPEGSCSA